MDESGKIRLRNGSRGGGGTRELDSGVSDGVCVL